MALAAAKGLTSGSLSCIVLKERGKKNVGGGLFLPEPGESKVRSLHACHGYKVGNVTHLVSRVVVGAAARAAQVTFLTTERDEMREYMVDGEQDCNWWILLFPRVV